MAIPPFSIDETLPQSSNFMTQYPGQSQAFRDIVESWLTMLSDPTTGLLRSSAFPTTFAFSDIVLTVKSTDAGAAAMPVFTLYRASATPAAADNGPSLNLDFNNSAIAQKTAFAISTSLTDVAAGTEDSTVFMSNIVAGVVTPRITLNAAGAIHTGIVTFTG